MKKPRTKFPGVFYFAIDRLYQVVYTTSKLQATEV
jgi:hypothetical protein